MRIGRWMEFYPPTTANQRVEFLEDKNVGFR